MADYKRMVSYMYQYEKGLKRKNVGYARIEQKSGQIKITLHMQLLGQLDSIFPTYLIQRDDSGMELIYLGDSVLKSQLMDSKHATEESNVMGSGHNFSKIGGILIFLNEDIFYATEWDDKPVVAKEVMEALKPKTASNRVVDSSFEEEKLSNDVKEDSLGEGLSTNETASIKEKSIQNVEVVNKDNFDTKIKDVIISGKEVNEDEATVSETKVETADSFLNITASDTIGIENEYLIPKYRLPGGYKYIEAFKNSQTKADMVRDIIEEALREEILQDTTAQQEVLNHETIQDKYVKEKMFQEELIHNTVVKEYAKKEVENVDDNNKLYDNEEFYGNKNDNEELNENEEFDDNEELNDNEELDDNKKFNDVNDEVEGIEEVVDDKFNKTAPENPSAARIFEHYPRIYPFEDNEITMCVKIEPKDIGYLPMEAWGLSNNSFLLHGFYCYHHLIFAKIVDRFGCRYMIGVPGIYHSREQFMARMFGFENFKPIRKREVKQGDFGYWYLVLSL